MSIGPTTLGAVLPTSMGPTTLEAVASLMARRQAPRKTPARTIPPRSARRTSSVRMTTSAPANSGARMSAAANGARRRRRGLVAGRFRL